MGVVQVSQRGWMMLQFRHVEMVPWGMLVMRARSAKL